MRKRTLLKSAACVALAALASAALAQPFPAKPLKIIVPFPAGGTTDIVARLVAQRMTETMGQTVLVENRGGAGGQLGAEAVAKSPADGYTLLMHNVTFPLASAAAQLAGRPLYNVDSDFAGVSIAVYVPLVITANPGVPAKDLRELAKLLQGDRSLHYSYGSTGPGSFMHVMGEAFTRDAKVQMTHVPLKGAAPLKQELLAGRLQVGGDQLSSSLAEIRSGKLRALATNASKRIPELPEVPTVRELGYPSMEADGWNGLFVPAKTPRDVVERLHREVVAPVKHPETAKRFAELAAEPVGSTPAEQDAILRRQLEQFRPIIKDMKLE
jgi:tripartite-type tricarboxylate transporter receptor subunit TctC